LYLFWIDIAVYAKKLYKKILFFRIDVVCVDDSFVKLLSGCYMKAVGTYDIASFGVCCIGGVKGRDISWIYRRKKHDA
jgi:hypothetical protein